MSGIEDILQSLPVDSIAKQLGVEKEQANQAIELALPALLGGMHANAQDESGANSLTKALAKHEGKEVKNADASQIDTTDGKKIVRNVFGDNTEQVEQALSATGSAAGPNISGLVTQVLPLLAPLVMGYLANTFQGNSQSKNTSGGGEIGDLLGGLLGNLGGGSSNSSSNGGLLDSLGGLFGGNSSNKNSGGSDMLGNLLGGLLGGGKKS